MRKLAILIPARNEEKVLTGCLTQLDKLIDKKDIYLVNDASTDQTAKIARKFTKNVLNLAIKSGKAIGLNKAIKYFKLTKKYQFIFPLDADTRIDETFLENIYQVFNNDKQGKIVAVVGKIKGMPTSATAAFRVWEYEIAQAVHKNAQSSLSAIMVCSGCSTVYRSKIFTRIQFSNETLTEDMDLTFAIHRQDLGKIVYTGKAAVSTQDPQHLLDLKKQLDRWYGGFWQCVLKHKIPFKGQALDFEVGWSALESVFSGLLMVVFLISLPVLLIKKSLVVLIILGLDLMLFTIPTVGWVAWKQKNWSIVQYIPYFYFLRVFSAMIFLKSYMVKLLNLDSKVRWNQAERFALKGA